MIAEVIIACSLALPDLFFKADIDDSKYLELKKVVEAIEEIYPNRSYCMTTKDRKPKGGWHMSALRWKEYYFFVERFERRAA